ncbi:SLC13 family permease [Anaerotignum sp.]|uniref:SLC13 family permease n=1 Tax=Anaerotignum sp. TaxID=2039241 RepID=UPI00289CDAF9|nr:SLC13 family permease [Anaerotignum sp.]
MTQAIISLIVLAIMAVIFVTDKLPLALTSMLGAVFLVLAGVLPVEKLFAAFSGSTIVLLAAMMVIGSALFHTGIAEKMSDILVKATGTSENGILVATVLVSAILSSICSGVAVVAMLLPIVIGISMKANISVSRQLIPLAFAASFGCNLTLVGAASNVVVNGQLEELGATPLTFLELGKVGIPISIFGILYFLTVGKKFMTQGDKSDKSYLMEFTGQAEDKIEKGFSTPKAALCLVILAVVLVAMALNSPKFPMYLVATVGALIMILTGCIKEQEAYKAIDWSTIFIVGGMSGVSKAMDISGAGKIISNGAVALLGDSPSKMIVLFVIFILTVFLTNIMMNTSTALLVTPLFIPIAINLGINPTAIAVAICVAASSPFLSPVGSGTNTLVVRPGNLGFMDFFKPGLGMTLVVTVVSMIFIPIFWPL